GSHKDPIRMRTRDVASRHPCPTRNPMAHGSIALCGSTRCHPTRRPLQELRDVFEHREVPDGLSACREGGRESVGSREFFVSVLRSPRTSRCRRTIVAAEEAERAELRLEARLSEALAISARRLLRRSRCRRTLCRR